MAFELLAQSPVSALALDTTPLSLPTDQYASTVANRQKAPQATASGDESTEDVYESHKDMFTKDAWLGMQRYGHTAKFSLFNALRAARML